MQKQVSSAMCGLGLAIGLAEAGISKNTVPFPGGFGQVAAFSETNGSLSPGSDLQTMLGTPKDFHEAAFGAGGDTSVVGWYHSGQIINSMAGTFGFGYLSADGSNSSPDLTPFAAVAVNGGWKETFTVIHPTLTGTGYLVFRVRGKGIIHTTGMTGSGYLIANPYKNNALIMQNAHFNVGDSDVVGTSNQYARWGLASFGTPDSRSFDGVTTMSVPFTFGVSFNLGVYAMAAAGQRSSGPGGSSSATIHAEFRWDGLVGVFKDAGAVSGATVISGSGKDWGPASAPCPSDFNGDGRVDDSDFTIFVVAYNILDCADPAMPGGCPADVNGDGFVDDADFTLFVGAYNALICP